jgi:hypothetical protein
MKVVRFIFFIFFFLLIFEFGIFFLLNKKSLSKKTTVSSFLPPSPTIAPLPSNLKVEFVPLERSDKEGRTVIVKANIEHTILDPYLNINLNPNIRTRIFESMTAVFVDFKKISSSPDLYLLTKDPKRNIPFPVFRINFSKNFGCPPTTIYLLSLNQLKDNPQRAINKMKKIASFDKLSNEKIDFLFKKGDVITVFACLDSQKRGRVDENKYQIASSIILRRFEKE